MKKLAFIIMTLGLSVAAQAQSTNLPSYSHFFNVTAETMEVSPLCPPNALCIVDGTVVELTYQVSCTEKMISFTYDSIEKDGELHVFVNALVGTNMPNGPVCLAFQYQTEKIQLINQYGKVVLHEMGIATH